MTCACRYDYKDLVQISELAAASSHGEEQHIAATLGDVGQEAPTVTDRLSLGHPCQSCTGWQRVDTLRCIECSGWSHQNYVPLSELATCKESLQVQNVSQEDLDSLLGLRKEEAADEITRLTAELAWANDKISVQQEAIAELMRQLEELRATMPPQEVLSALDTLLKIHNLPYYPREDGLPASPFDVDLLNTVRAWQASKTVPEVDKAKPEGYGGCQRCNHFSNDSDESPCFECKHIEAGREDNWTPKTESAGE